jgi:purine-nucleoside phosphorylase
MRNMTSSAPLAEASANAVRARWSRQPRVGLVLGSGLGGLADQIDVEARLDYTSIPHFAAATAPGHRGQCVCGMLAGSAVMAFDGRVHGYEGRTAAQSAFPVRVLSALGAKMLIVTNACGGMNPHYRAGDIMAIQDQINLTWDNPLVGPHETGCPDMSQPFDPALIARARAIARRSNFSLHVGMYVGVQGPNFETRAEYRFLRRIGGDAVGMSTVAETIVAVQCGLRVLGLSVVTNECLPDRLRPTNADRVLAVAAAAEPNVCEIVVGVIAHDRTDVGGQESRGAPPVG